MVIRWGELVVYVVKFEESLETSGTFVVGYLEEGFEAAVE